MRVLLRLVGVILLALPAAVLAQSRSLATYTLFAEDKVRLGPNVLMSDGDLGSNHKVVVAYGSYVDPQVDVVADEITLGAWATIRGDTYFNTRRGSGSFAGTAHPGLALPVLTLPTPPTMSSGTAHVVVERDTTRLLLSGAYGSVIGQKNSTLLVQGQIDVGSVLIRSASAVNCLTTDPCTIRVRDRLSLSALQIGQSGGPLTIDFAGASSVAIGRLGGQVRATVVAPYASLRLRSSGSPARTVNNSEFIGQFVGRRITVGSGATVQYTQPLCGNGVLDTAEACDPPNDAACPGRCGPACTCVTPILHAVGPSVFHNATAFGLQLFGENFLPGSQLELSDRTSGAILATLPAIWASSSEMTAHVPAGMSVPAGIQRELVAKVVSPGGIKTAAPDIGHCQTDRPTSPTACTDNTDCPSGTGSCLNGDQRLTLFNDLAFVNPNSAVVVPAPNGLCDDGAPCQGAADCAGIGSGACSPKLYVTPQQIDELWVFNTGTQQFADLDAGQGGIQGIPVGDNPFHVELLTAGGPSRAWVVNRFEDSVSIIDPATDTEVVRLTGAALGVPGGLRMETEVEFNRAGTRAYLSNENLDEVQVLDIAGARRDAPVLLDTIDVGVNPRGMATNAADTRLYVANVQSADVSVVDIASGSATENQVLTTVAARPTDDIVGGRADGWEAFVVGGRAPRGIVFSDALDAIFLTSIGPQTGPRQGVVQVGGAIINPTVTVIDAATNTIRAHVALQLFDRDLPSCTDPELMALDDVRGRLYVTCQGSGTVDVLDTTALAAGLPAELAIVSLPLPTDTTVPTLSLPPDTGAFSAKVCGAFTSNRGAACTSDADCSNCPPLVEGLPVVCCMRNNPVGLHNGPRGIALSADGNALYVVNQFTTSVASLDVSPVDPTAITVTDTRSFPGAFGTDTPQRDRRLGQIEFFTDVKKTGVSCATCHIDDHQDGVFFEADVRGPRLRRVLSVRGTRDFPPLLQDQLVPDLLSFTDIVVQAERGGPIPCIPCIEINGSPFCFNGGTCTVTSDTENQQNALYAKAITFFPNPNLNADGSFSTAVPLPSGLAGDAVRGAEVFDQLACQTCHPEPLFTIDQLRAFDPSTLGQPVRMRDTGTPVFIPLRAKCQDINRPTGNDSSTGFSVPTLRGVWDTFPLLVSGSAGLAAVGSEPAFSAGCTPGSSGCCAQLQSPLNPGGIVVPPQHLDVTTKDAIRAVLTAPLAVPGTGHGAALGLPSSDLNALIAYIRSL